MTYLTFATFFLIVYFIMHIEEVLYFFQIYSGRKVQFQRIYRTRYKQNQQEFAELLFALAAKLCRADGAVQMSEIDRMEQLIRDRLHLNDASALKAKRAFSKAKDSRRTFDSYLDAFYERYSGQHELLEIAYEFLRIIAAVGGTVRAEQVLLDTVKQKFNIYERNYQSSFSGTSASSLSQAYSVLGCTPDTDFKTVKRTYRKLMLELHPDKLNTKGMSAEFINIAKERFLRVQAAYEQIEKATGK